MNTNLIEIQVITIGEEDRMKSKNKAIYKWFKKNERFFSTEMNGYNYMPIDSYLFTLFFINRNGKVMDLGCGNGILLKFLMTFSSHSLIPFGVDLNKKAIRQAKEVLLPRYKDNFTVDNVKDYDFRNGPFDFIIANPFYSRPNMRNFTKKCLKNLNDDGRLIFRIHNDVLKRYKISSLKEIRDFKFLGMKTFKFYDLEIAVLDKKSL